MNQRYRWLFIAATTAACSAAHAAHPGRDFEVVPGGGHPGCEQVDARACVGLAIDAMGGRARLAGIATVQFDAVGHRAMAEQSYRQSPFITVYERDKVTMDFGGGRLARNYRLTMPMIDPDKVEIDGTVVATAQGGVRRGAKGDTPCSPADLDAVAEALALGPERLLLTAAAASDLHYAPPQWLRSTPHTVVEFDWHGTPVRVLLNGSNHLPDARQRTTTFRDYWFAWGDVDQRVYFDNWHIVDGMVIPTNRVEQRNGVPWTSTQRSGITFNGEVKAGTFTMDAKAAAASAASKGWDRPFSDKAKIELAPGIELYRGAWNTTLVRQDDGVLVLEAPIAPSYAQAVFAKARASFPGAAIKGVLTSSDSWPHVAGVREAVAERLPVYVLDLNQPLLARMVAAPHSLRPDRLQRSPAPPQWRVVHGRLQIGSGANRAVLYPLRGAATERQYMVYFPQHRLLYASDTLALLPDKSLYNPQLMHEVVQAVEREHLQVDTVFAMHQGPTPWKDVRRMVAQALK